MRYHYEENGVNMMDMYTGTICGRNHAGVYVQIDESNEFAFVKNAHSLRNGTRILGSVKFPPSENRCMTLEIDSILSYADAA